MTGRPANRHLERSSRDRHCLIASSVFPGQSPEQALSTREGS